MEVVAAAPMAVPPVHAVDFNFDSACSSPYITAPSSPQRFGSSFFLSAPTSPARRSSSFVRDQFNHFAVHSHSSSSIPFDWEEKPGTPKARNINKKMFENNVGDDDSEFSIDRDGDFEFDFSGQLDRTSLSAEELFDGGKIRPLKPPPGYDSSVVSTAVSSPTSSSPRSRNHLLKKKDFDPFQAAIEETTRTENRRKHAYSQNRGRGRTISCSYSSSSSNYVHKGSRSLSPLRVSDLILDQEEEINSRNNDNDDKITAVSPSSSTNPKTSYASSFLSAISFSSKGYKKWKLKDLLLFRSASEGRATGKDPLTKYAATLSSKRAEMAEDVKNTSFRSTDSSLSGGSSRRRGRVSAHELHYTANRAVSEEMKRKTFLPYKQGLLGCLGFNSGMHEISRGMGSLTCG